MFCSVPIGDLNVKAHNEKTLKLRLVHSGSIRDRGYSNPFFSSHILGVRPRILEEWIEIIQPLRNHFNHNGRCCSRIERCWVFCPSYFLIKMQTSSNVAGAPEGLYGNGFSDHAPVVLAFGRKPRKCNSCNPLPKHVCKHPEFKVYVARFIEYCNLLQVLAHQQLGVQCV